MSSSLAQAFGPAGGDGVGASACDSDAAWDCAGRTPVVAEVDGGDERVFQRVVGGDVPEGGLEAGHDSACAAEVLGMLVSCR